MTARSKPRSKDDLPKNLNSEGGAIPSTSAASSASASAATTRATPTRSESKRIICLSTRATPKTVDPSAIRADIQFAPVDYNNPKPSSERPRESQSQQPEQGQRQQKRTPTIRNFEPGVVTEFDSGKVAQPFLDPDALEKVNRRGRGNQQR